MRTIFKIQQYNENLLIQSLVSIYDEPYSPFDIYLRLLICISSLIIILSSPHMMAHSTLLESDPFEFLLRQKTIKNHPQKQKSIKLNLNRLPPDFFPVQRIRRLQSLSQRAPSQNEFLHYHQTLDLRSQRKVSSNIKEPKRINPFSVKRESLCSSRKVETQRHHATEPREDQFEGFNCTFAKKMNSQCLQLKKVQFPILDLSKRGKVRAHTHAIN